MIWLILTFGIIGFISGIFEHWQYGSGASTALLGAVVALAAGVELLR